MKKPLGSAAIVALAALGLAVSACDSQAEQEVEKTAKAIDESYEAEADLKEAVAQGGPNEAAAHNEAEALRNEGEQIKDNLEDAADELDDAPQ